MSEKRSWGRGIARKDWFKRNARRIDLTSKLTHLTRKQNGTSRAKMIFKILDEEKITGTSKFIVGSDRVVYFQDAPLYSLAQNIWFEKDYRKEYGIDKVRYNASGLAFMKQLVYQQGGRPAFYEKTDVAKSILPSNEWWRIVCLNMENSKNIVDWTHEREWRVKGDFEFQRKDAIVLLSDQKVYKEFINLCVQKGKAYYKEIASIVVMNRLLF